MLYKNFQYSPDCLHMFFYCLHKDKDVIQVHNYNAFCYKVLEDIIYHSLEGSHSKKHYQGFKEFMVGLKGGLPFISRFNSYVIKILTDI